MQARVALQRVPGDDGQPLTERHDLAQGFLQVVRRDRRELVERRVGALQLGALRLEVQLRGAALRDVLDREQDDACPARGRRHEARVEQHDLAADSRERVVDLEIIEARFYRELVTQQRAKRRDVPLSVAERKEHFADRVRSLDAENAKEGAIRVRDAKLVIENEQRLADGVDDVQEQLLFNGTSRPTPSWSAAGKTSMFGTGRLLLVGCMPVIAGRCIGRSVTGAR